MTDTALLFSVFFVAWFFQAFTGFGAGIFIVGILSLTYDPKTVVVSSALVNLVGTLTMALLLLRNVRPNLKVLFTLIAGSVPGIFIGGKLLMLFDKETIRLIIGFFILLLGVYDLSVQGLNLRGISMKESAALGVVSGFVGGLFAGLIGMGGPPPVVYLNQVERDVDVFKATLTFFFISNILFRVVAYNALGGQAYFDERIIFVSLFAIPPAIVLGLRSSRMVRPKRLKVLISLSVTLLGFLLISL